LRRVAEAAIAAGTASVVVVLGAHAETIAPCLDGLPVQIVVHPGWAEGMGSSARSGVRAFTERVTEPRGVIIALADQPNLSAVHFTRLVAAHDCTGRRIVASLCRGAIVPPAFFACEYIPALLRLEGEAGARALFKAHPDDLATVPADDLWDLDSPENYQAYLGSNPVGLSGKVRTSSFEVQTPVRNAGQNTQADHV